MKTFFILAALMCLTTAKIVHIDLENALGDKAIELQVGDMLKIEVPQNPTTGFSWIYVNPSEKNGGALSIVKDDYVRDAQPENGEPMHGQGGKRFILIRAEEAGVTEVFEMVYAKAWEFNGVYSPDNDKIIGYHKIFVKVLPKDAFLA